MKWSKIIILSTLQLCLCFSLPAQLSAPGTDTNGLKILSVSVNNEPVPIRHGDKVNLGPFPQGIAFTFTPLPNSGPSPLRIHYRMEGYEHTWHEYAGAMYLGVRFFNSQGDQITYTNFFVSGDSVGWNGSLKSSPLTHRRETVVAPPQAATVWFVISSAGPPSTVGVYVVADLVISKSSGDSPYVRLIQPSFDNQTGDEPGNLAPPGWVRDGTHPSLAKIVNYGMDPAAKALAIVDDDTMSHAEWHTVKDSAPRVSPGDRLLIEWNEMYTMGVGDYRIARYSNLPPGNFQLNLVGVDVMGNPTNARATLSVLVPQPFWRTLWFWSLVLFLIAGVTIGGARYWVWRKLRLEMLRLQSQQVLEKERLRIAHDIHDDLGARITQISLVSTSAQSDPTVPAKSRADFDRISQMSKELVSAVYETVWAVNPDNDNLEALGIYLCQIVNQLCERTQIRCRFHMTDLPPEIEVSSQIRHNISLAVKEAVHNAIKHAKASEIAIQIDYKESLLAILVRDDGCGFQTAANFSGNGLRNITRRLESIGGTCMVASELGKGSTIELRLVIRPGQGLLF